jgi:predicted metal-dependent peptidase
MKILGLGGTVLQPAIDYVVENFNEFNTVVLTDGYCDSLDLSRVKGKVLMVSIGTKVPITRSNGKVKQIMVEKEN